MIDQSHSHSRRGFLRGAIAAGVAAVTASSAAIAAAEQAASATAPSAVASAPARHAEFLRRLVGPIYSNPCPFTKDLEPDDDAQRRGIHRAIKYGVGVFACTAGNTKYATMNLDEVRRVNRVMVEAVNRRALAIAATGDWSTADAAEFARFAESCGADGLQVMLPKHAQGSEDDAVRHFEAIAQATKLPLVLHGRYSKPLLTRLVQLESIAAMKEDSAIEEYIWQQIEFGHRLTIFGGGAENRFLVARPYGAKAYYSTYTTFAPAIAMRFWKAIQAGDEKQAVAITLKYDYPFIRRFTHGFWHATLEHFRIGTRYVRPPHKTFTDEEMKEVAAFFDAQGVSPDDYEA